MMSIYLPICMLRMVYWELAILVICLIMGDGPEEVGVIEMDVQWICRQATRTLVWV